MKRRDFQDLASIRLKEAKILLDRKCWDGAYYLGGYAVECALKACIATRTQRHEFPDKKRVLGRYSHALADLVQVAGLEQEFDRMEKAEPEFAENWQIVRDWSEQSWSRARAESLMNAIDDRNFGVLRWLEQRW